MKKIPFNWFIIILFFFILGGYFMYDNFFKRRVTKMEQLEFRTGVVKELGTAVYNGNNALYFTTTTTQAGFEVPIAFGCCYYPTKFESKMNKGDTIDYAIDKKDISKLGENTKVYVYSLKKGDEIFADVNGILAHESSNKALYYGLGFWVVGGLLYWFASKRMAR